jgi:hypothetical protein
VFGPKFLSARLRLPRTLEHARSAPMVIVPSQRATPVGNMASIQRFAQGTQAAATLSEPSPSC